MSNEKNLIPFDERTESEQREIAQQGGIASGAARRRKRNLREAADLFLSLPVSDRRKFNGLARKGLPPEEIDNQMALVVGQWKAACGGDARAASVLVRLLGEEQPREAPDASALSKAADLLGGVPDALEETD